MRSGDPARAGSPPTERRIDAHGSPGCFELGQDDIDKEAIQDFVNHVQKDGEGSSINGKISELNLFACSVAAGDAGQSFLEQLAAKLRASVSGYTAANWDTKEPRWYTAGERREKFPPVADCLWDCDGSNDGFVTVGDLLAVLTQWDLTNDSPPDTCDAGGDCDYDGNGCVDVTDLLKLLAQWSDTAVNPGTECPCPDQPETCPPGG